MCIYRQIDRYSYILYYYSINLYAPILDLACAELKVLQWTGPTSHITSLATLKLLPGLYLATASKEGEGMALRRSVEACEQAWQLDVFFYFLCLPGNGSVANTISGLWPQALQWDVTIFWRCDTAVVFKQSCWMIGINNSGILDTLKVWCLKAQVHWKVTSPYVQRQLSGFQTEQTSTGSFLGLHGNSCIVFGKVKNTSNWFRVSNDCCIARCVKLA